MCDMAHFAGLVAAGLHPNPVPHCDFVTSTTHKTLAGPRSGFILCREEHALAVDKAVFPGMQGGPLCHTVAAKATCFKIAGTQPFREYQQQIRTNADVLGETLQEGGLDILTGGTDTHLLLVDLRSTDWSGKEAEERLHEVNVTVNRNTIPFDERPPMQSSGIRIGTPAVTMRGFDEDDCREVGEIIVGALGKSPDIDSLRGAPKELCRKRPLYPGLPRLPDVHDRLSPLSQRGLETLQSKLRRPLPRADVPDMRGAIEPRPAHRLQPDRARLLARAARRSRSSTQAGAAIGISPTISRCPGAAPRRASSPGPISTSLGRLAGADADQVDVRLAVVPGQRPDPLRQLADGQHDRVVRGRQQRRPRRPAARRARPASPRGPS